MRRGVWRCEGERLVCRGGEGRNEECNGIDDDCDGLIDETFQGAGEPCRGDINLPCSTGQLHCVDGVISCNIPEPGIEVCNGLDDNCNGVIDDTDACGQWVQDHCRIAWGWRRGQGVHDAGQGPWQNCWESGVILRDDQRCVTTQRDGRFVHLTIDGDVGKNGEGDEFVFGFRCGKDAEAQRNSSVPL